MKVELIFEDRIQEPPANFQEVDEFQRVEDTIKVFVNDGIERFPDDEIKQFRVLEE